MTELQHLIKNLSKSEKKMVRKFVSSYSSNGKSDTLTLQLFDVLNKRKRVLNNKACAEILFGKDERNRIRVLKSRLKQKILDALTTDLILANQKVDETTKLSIQLKKKLVQFQVLYYSKKSTNKIPFELLEDIIQKATNYELYSVLMEAINIKKILFGMRLGLSEFNFYEEQYKQALIDYNAFTSIVSSYYRVILNSRLHGTNKSHMRKIYRSAIDEGNNVLLMSNSKNARYYLNVIKYGSLIANNNLDEANQVMLQQLDLLLKNKAVYRTRRMGATYDYLCQTNLCLGNYMDASHFASKGKKHFKKGELNYAVAEELEFKAHLFDNNFVEAENIIKNIQRHYNDKKDAHRLSTHQFFKANMYFAKGEFKKCNRLLAQDYNF